MLPAVDTITTATDHDAVGTDTTTQASNIDGDNAEVQTTQKSEVTTVMTDSESDTITITVGSEADSEATTPKSDVDTTDLPEDAGIRTGVEVINPAEEGETTTTKIVAEDEDADDMTDEDEVTTPKTLVDEEGVDGEG